ncbi:MAG TPA: HAD-IC family P-type ATPase, partial [Chlamydiales bacterium]
MTIESWHLKSIEETLCALNASKHGLSHQEANLRLDRFGPNRLKVSGGPSLLVVFARQFLNPLIFVLIGAALIKLVTSSLVDGIVLIITIFLMALIGFFQEMKAERAIQSLKDLTAHKTRVMRNGKMEIIPSENLVPGDEIYLKMGDKISADARLIEATNLKINESMLTGESMAVEKNAETMGGDSVLAERKNMLYAGTVVSFGKGTAIVVQTGMLTELGKIAASLKEIKPEKTPLQRSIHAIGNWMLVCIFFAIALFILVSFYKGLSLSDIFFLSVAAAVSAIPEGLPVAFTASLAAGMYLMAKKNAIIRRLVAVETLGSTTVICSDKTGTLTFNQMAVSTLYSLEKSNISSKKIFEIGALCNDALISKKGAQYELIGDPTEGAILIAAAQTGIDLERLSKSFPRVGEIPFLSENLFMATLHSSSNGQWVYVKGAPEKILSMCTFVLAAEGPIALKEEVLKQIEKAIEQMTENALRLIAVAYCEVNSSTLTEDLFRGKLIFAGIFGMIDPPRKEAMKAIASCKEAGIRVVMITGDNPMTAAAI